MSSATEPQPISPSSPTLFGRIKALSERRATWVLVDQAVVSLGNFLTSNQIARHMPAKDYGVFSLLLETILYLNSLQAALIIYPMTVRGATDRNHLGRLAMGSLWLTLCLLPILGIATAFSVHRVEGTMFMAISAVGALLLWQMQETTRRALISDLRFADAVWGDAVSYLGQAAFVFVAAQLGKLNLNLAFLGMGITSAAAMMLQAFQIGLKPISISQVKDVVRDFWVLGRWMLLSNAGAVVSSLGYWYVLQASHGDEACAIFGAIVNMLKLANPIMSSMANLIVPAVARESATHGLRAARRIALRYIGFGAALLAPYFALLLIFPHWMLQRFYGVNSPYADYSQWLRLFVLNYMVAYIAQTIGSWLAGLQHSKLGFHTQLVNVIVTLAVGLPLTYKYGVRGLVFGGLIAIFATALTSAYYIRVIWKQTPAEAV